MSVYSDHAYRRRTAALKRRAMKNNEPCALCGRAIDFTLPYTDKWSFTAEHSDPISLGGDLLGPILPAHRQPSLQQLQRKRHKDQGRQAGKAIWADPRSQETNAMVTHRSGNACALHMLARAANKKQVLRQTDYDD